MKRSPPLPAASSACCLLCSLPSPGAPQASCHRPPDLKPSRPCLSCHAMLGAERAGRGPGLSGFKTQIFQGSRPRSSRVQGPDLSGFKAQIFQGSRPRSFRVQGPDLSGFKAQVFQGLGAVLLYAPFTPGTALVAADLTSAAASFTLSLALLWASGFSWWILADRAVAKAIQPR